MVWAIGNWNLFGNWDLVIAIYITLPQEILIFHQGK
jgi:hypothetical protein